MLNVTLRITSDIKLKTPDLKYVHSHSDTLLTESVVPLMTKTSCSAVAITTVVSLKSGWLVVSVPTAEWCEMYPAV